MNREQFENLPEIAKRISASGAFYCNKGEWYLCGDKHREDEVYLDGALYAYQEQQKRIDTVLKAVEWHIEDCGIGEDTEYNKAWLEAMLFVKQELRK